MTRAAGLEDNRSRNSQAGISTRISTVGRRPNRHRWPAESA